MTTLLFNTIRPRVVGHVDVSSNRFSSWHDGHFDTLDQIIEQEPQFYQATPDFIEMTKQHNSLTHMILEQLYEIIRGHRQHMFDAIGDYHSLRIDVKRHMLMPGWYPCIPGWYCDFVTRDNKRNIQPNKEDEKVRHWVVVLGENITPTEFLHTRDVNVRLKKSPHWSIVDAGINNLVEADKVKRSQVNPNDIVMFRGNELHRELPAENYCWRYFFRASLFPKKHPCRPSGTQGKIQPQQQVYLDITKGW